MTPESFWKLTFAEFWALYDGKFEKRFEPMTMQEYREDERRFVNGNT